ncbi:MAG: hypothetical protein BWY79_00778 [Actinobacteria bacterium ADurb.Bin444]|nr:MAG: hypothetical protein BWY79_00778 [Actinobacteria bacterium ADurb.Bin444]
MAVEPLMVMEYHQAQLLELAHVGEDPVPGHGVVFDDLPALRRQLLFAAQHLVGHADLPQVMQKPGKMREVTLSPAQPELAGDIEGVLGHTGRVLRGVVVFEVESSDHAGRHLHGETLQPLGQLHLPGVNAEGIDEAEDRQEEEGEAERAGVLEAVGETQTENQEEYLEEEEGLNGLLEVGAGPQPAPQPCDGDKQRVIHYLVSDTCHHAAHGEAHPGNLGSLGHKRGPHGDIHQATSASGQNKDAEVRNVTQQLTSLPPTDHGGSRNHRPNQGTKDNGGKEVG